MIEKERADLQADLAETRDKLERLLERPPLASARHRRVELVDAYVREIRELEGLLREEATA